MKEIRSQTIMSIMGTIFLTYRRSLQKKLLPAGSTLKQHYVLRQLIKREYMQPSEIADELFCDRPTASVIIKNLQKHGWITREKAPDNRKFHRITITAKGRAQVEKTKDLIIPDHDPFAMLNEDEKKQFARLLRKIRKEYVE